MARGRLDQLDRRTWARLIGAGAASLAVGCGDNLTAAESSSLAIVEPAADGFIAVVWSSLGDRATIAIRAGDQLVDEREVRIGPGGTGSTTVTGLAADRAYAVTASTTAGPVGPCRVRTAPRDDDPRPVRIAASADFDPDPVFDSDLIAHLLAAEPDLFVSLGDFPYTDNGPVPTTVAEYRQRHVDHRTAPAGRRLFEGVGVRAIYDDHEFHNDWDPTFVRAVPGRYAASMQVWDELFPIRDPIGDIRYRRWRWGAHVECFLLDCRRFRSENAAPDDAAKQMLGAIQRAWLTEGVRASAATFKLVFTSVPLDFALGNDSWSAFTTERALLLDALVGVPGVLFVAADQHYFAAHRHAHGVREFQVGPLARGLGEFGALAPGVLFRSQRYNVGVFDIDGDRLVVTGLGPDGERFYEERLTAAELTPT